MSSIFHLVFVYLHLLIVHKYVQSSPVLSYNDLYFEQLLNTVKINEDCKDVIIANILSMPPQEWCQRFNLYKDFMIGSNDCNQTEYETLTRAACSKEDFVVMTERTVNPITPKIHTSARQTTLSNITIPTAHMSTPMSTHTTTTPTSMPKTTHTATTIPTTHMSTQKTTDTTTPTTIHASVPNTIFNTNVSTTPGFSQVQLKINTSSSITAEGFVFKPTESDRRLESNLDDLLQQVTAYKNQTAHIEVCQKAAMTKLTRESGVGMVCATVKQLKEMLDEKCVKTDYDLLVVETFQLFDCLMCRA